MAVGSIPMNPKDKRIARILICTVLWGGNTFAQTAESPPQGPGSSSQAADSPAQTADSPAAQAAYCIRYLREMDTKLGKQVPFPDPLEATKLQWRAKVRSLLEAWRLYLPSLQTADSQVVRSEFRRGTSQADSDIAYIESQTKARFTACKQANPTTVDVRQCVFQKTKAAESDPMVSAVRERGAQCMRGPSP